MGGRFSRQKGVRGELALRDYLLANEFEDAFRVPLSGAMAHYKGDVIGFRNGVQHLFELKCRKDLFLWVYAYLDQKGPRTFSLDGALVAIDYSLDSVAAATSYDHLPVEFTKTGKRIVKLRDFVGESEYLVLKCDRRPYVFVRYS